MKINKGVTGFNSSDIEGQVKAELIAEDFTRFLNEFHSYSEPYDDPMDAWLHKCYAEAKGTRKYFDYKSQPYFSPSSANSCDRELYEKILRAKRDEEDVVPHRRRWTAIGTAIGDTIQRELLLAERHFKKFTGKEPMFKVERTEQGYPFFEDFVRLLKVVEHKGKRFALHGTCDGVLKYVDPATGEVLRVGLEIKSKQTTYAQTSIHSMREPKEDHVKQAVCYGIMYDVDYYIVLYVNASHKSWFMTLQDLETHPDIRAFGVYITDEMKNAVLDKFANVVEAVEFKAPPKLDLSKWTFNNFKKACALSLTESELADLKEQLGRIQKSRMPDWLKRQYNNTLEQIKGFRDAG